MQYTYGAEWKVTLEWVAGVPTRMDGYPFEERTFICRPENCGPEKWHDKIGYAFKIGGEDEDILVAISAQNFSGQIVASRCFTVWSGNDVVGGKEWFRAGSRYSLGMFRIFG